MSIVHDKIKSYDLYTTKENMKEDILSGLQSQRKSISAKYLYDQRGSELFEEITVLDEYYPTRSEIEILFLIIGLNCLKM